jgi:hypothetical protein
MEGINTHILLAENITVSTSTTGCPITSEPEVNTNTPGAKTGAEFVDRADKSKTIDMQILGTSNSTQLKVWSR